MKHKYFYPVRANDRICLTFSAIFSIFLLFLTCAGVSAQCCLVDSLNISTGYNPSTGSMVTTGLPASDPKWQVGTYSSSLHSEIVATPATPLTSAADVITPPSGASWYGVSGWISCISSGSFYCTSSSSSGVLLQNTFTRTFTLCDSACVGFSFKMCDDYLIANISVSGYGTIFTGQSAGNNHSAYQTVLIPCVPLSAGTHTITVTLNQEDNGNATNFIGLNLQGEVYAHPPGGSSSYYQDIVSESSSCTTYSCSPPETEFTGDFCQGDTSYFVPTLPGETFTGSTWTVTPAGRITFVSISPTEEYFIGATAGDYTITLTQPCEQITYVIGSVAPTPTVSVTASSNNICPGTTVTLTATYTVTGGGSLASYGWGPVSTCDCNYDVVSPTSSTSYWADVTWDDGIHCTSKQDSITIHVIPRPPAPTIPADTICPGHTATLTATDLDPGYTPTFTWGPSGPTLSCTTCNPEYASPSTTSVYTVYASNGSCAGPATPFTVTVMPITIGTITPITICAGHTATLTASVTGPATSYSWAGPGFSASTLTATVTPSASGTYTLTASNPSGCSATATVTVTVLPVPAAPAITGTLIICAGASTTLTATATYSGTVTPLYIWGPATGLSCTTCDPVIASPGATTTYSVYATAGGCPGRDTSFTVTVNPVPTVTAVSEPTVCAGTAAVLTATVSGASSYSWSGPSGFSSTLLTVSVTPTVTTVYTLTVTNSSSCTAVRTATVTVNPIPSAPYFNGSPAICLGDSVEIGAADSVSTSTYTWSPGTGLSCTTCSTVMASPTVTTVYTVYATAGGCTGPSATDTVVVHPVPAITSVGTDVSDCAGVTITYTLTGTTSGATSYLWSGPGGYTSTLLTNVISITPTVTSVYNLTASNTYCSVDGTATVTVLPLPYASPVLSAAAVCVGDSLLLSDSVSGGTWSSSEGSVASVDASGHVTGVAAGTTIISYRVTGADGCVNIITQSFTVVPQPVAGRIIGTDTVCLGGYDALYDSISGGTLQSGNTAVATIDSSGSLYGVSVGTVVVTYIVSNGVCSVTATDTIKIVTLPVVPPISGEDTVCIGRTDTLTDAITGGNWFSYNTGVANIGASSGEVTGGSSGTAVMAYDVSNACGTTEVYDTLTVIPTDPPITGITAVCSGSTTMLYDIISGGTWSSSDASIASVNVTTGEVYGVATGTATITYTATSVCGPFTVTTAVDVNMPPFITTNFIVACQSLGESYQPTGSGPTTYILPDTSGCVEVCDSSVVRYYANGVDSSGFTWTVTGGVVVNSYAGNDSIDVMWPIVGSTCELSLADTFNHCIGSYDICIEVIQRPDANFEASSTSVCLNSPVSFADLSTADPLSPIVSWYWNFGDGTSSGLENPTHRFTTGGVTDTVSLTVKNACNCSSTYTLVVNVSSAPGPVISCPSIECDSQSATYSIPDDGCSGMYAWGVVGGTITSGSGTAAITVDWDAVGTSGIGYVGVIDPCSACPDSTVVSIPVIMPARISGPDTICAGIEYEYSLPLWPATRYAWGVLGDPSAFTYTKDDYKATVNFSAPGTYTIHAWYQNSIKLCGGNVDKTVTVIQNDSIIGSTTLCQYSTGKFNISDSLSGAWTLSNIAGTVIATGSGTVFTHEFDIPGVYVLSAIGAFCAEPVIINILQSPALVDSVKGQDTVCLGRVYTYTAYHDIPGTIYNWTATGGTVTPASGSPTVSVVWTGGGAMQLSVNRINTASPFCEGLPTNINIVREDLALNISGNTTPCSNSYDTFTTSYRRAETYSWSILPNTAGSVISGNYGTNPVVLWNNNSAGSTAGLVLTVTKCDSIYKDTLNITFSGSSALTLTADTVCPETPVTIRASSGGSWYIWNFGDGTDEAAGPQDTIVHYFPLNPTSGDVGYSIEVSVLPNPTAACPVSGNAFLNETVLPGPVAYVSSPSLDICPGPILLTGTETDNIGPFTYQWFDDEVPIGGGTSPEINISTVGYYAFQVTGVNGCSNMSNSLYMDTCRNPFGPCDSPIHCTISVTCNEITATAPTIVGYSDYHWLSANGITTLGSGSTITITEATAGYHTFIFEASATDTIHCAEITQIIDTFIKFVPSFNYALRCGTGGFDTAAVQDFTTYMPGDAPTSFSWALDGSGVGSGSSLSIPVSAPGTHTITETVGSCSISDTVTAPALSSAEAAFTYTASPICEGVPVNFAPVSTAATSYTWNFNDGAINLLEYPQRTFTYLPGPNPHVFTVTLTVTDTLGCTADTTALVQVYQNNDGGIAGVSQVVCSNAIPVSLGFIASPLSYPAVSYVWNTGATTSGISVDTSGSYWVTITDVYGCRTVTPTVDIQVLQNPPPTISGQQVYCQGETVSLSCYNSPDESYQWYRSGTLVSSTSTVSDAGLTAGTYSYMLIASVIDSAGVSCPDTVYDSVLIYTKPPAPTVAGPTVLNCSTYQLELKASETESGYYNWSDGTTIATDTVTTGGAYEVWFTDLNGCINSSTVYVPDPPGNEMAYFPSGCYSVCSEQYPLTLYGPPDVLFHPWAWWYDDTETSTGDGVMSPLTITRDGQYQWELNNGLCSAWSDTMDISSSPCTKCGGSFAAHMVCDESDPAGYTISIDLVSPLAGTSYIVGTNMGPITPFSGVLSAAGAYTLTLSFNTLIVPPPPTVNVEVQMTGARGQCFQSVVVPVPYPCGWVAERQSGDTAQQSPVMQNIAPSAMLIFPNPASGEVTVSYDYGSANYGQRTIAVYDELGRTMQSIVAQDERGQWQINTSSWADGMYIIRMEGDGQPLQTQRVVVTH